MSHRNERRRKRAVFGVLARLVVVSVLSRFEPVAIANELPRVGIEISSCRDLDVAEVERIAAIELTALVSPSGTVNPTQVGVRCTPPMARIIVADRLTAKTVERSLDLYALEPRARARVLAIAIAELVSASWMEIESNPEPIAGPIETRAASRARNDARAAVDRRFHRWTVGIGIAPTLRIFPDGPLVLYGGTLRTALVAAPPVLLSLEATFEKGTESVPLGNAEALMGSGAAAVAWRFGDRMPSDLGLGIRVGWGRLRGTPADSTTATGGTLEGVWAGPLLVAGTSLRLGRVARLRMFLESGYPFAAVHGRVDGASGASLAGPWLMAGLGVVFEP